MVKYLTVIIVFLTLLYFASRYLVKMRAVGKKGDIRLVDLLRLGTDSFIYVVEAMNKRYLIAQNKNVITLLDCEERTEIFESILRNTSSSEVEEDSVADSVNESKEE